MSTLTPTKETEIAEVTEITVEDAARRLTEFNLEAEPILTKVYLFPADDQVRLVEVDPTAPPIREGEGIYPYYFNPSPKDGVPYWSAIALIRPGEEERFAPPEGWGDWSDAKVLWEAP